MAAARPYAAVFDHCAGHPLIPGRSLYYATYCAVRQEMSLARDYAAQTAEYALGIALGASLVWAFANMRRSLVRHDPIPR